MWKSNASPVAGPKKIKKSGCACKKPPLQPVQRLRAPDARIQYIS